MVEAIPVTAVPRTLLDLAVAVRPERLERMLQRAEELKLFDLAAVEELLARTAGHHGHGRLRRSLALYRPPPFTRSELERRILAALHAAGLPPPLVNHGELGFELDLYWPEQRFVVELDVFETHGTRRSFEHDRLRDEELLLHGIDGIRVTGPRFSREPGAVITRLARLLENRAVLLGGGRA